MSQTADACAAMKVTDLPPLESWEKLRELDPATLTRRFKRGVDNFDRRIFQLTPEQADMSFLPDAGVGRWSVRVLLGHLADAELVWVHRMRRVIAEKNPIMAGWDEDAFVDAKVYSLTGTMEAQRAIGAFVATIHTLRQWTGEWLATIEPSGWSRTGMHYTRGEISVHDMLALDTWHVEHHARYLKCKLTRLVGAEPAPVGGCGPSCGCKK